MARRALRELGWKTRPDQYARPGLPPPGDTGARMAPASTPDPTGAAAWARLEAALDELLALPMAERDAAALRLSAGDDELLAELRGLLAGAASADSVLDHSAKAYAASQSSSLIGRTNSRRAAVLLKGESRFWRGIVVTKVSLRGQNRHGSAPFRWLACSSPSTTVIGAAHCDAVVPC